MKQCLLCKFRVVEVGQRVWQCTRCGAVYSEGRAVELNKREREVKNRG